MSRFYGEIRGQAKTSVTRMGSKNSGMFGHIRGWNIGATVELRVGPDGKDHIQIRITGGSNDPSTKRILIDTDMAGVEELNRIDEADKDPFEHGHIRCQVCGECITCNLRPCRNGKMHSHIPEGYDPFKKSE